MSNTAPTQSFLFANAINLKELKEHLSSAKNLSVVSGIGIESVLDDLTLMVDACIEATTSAIEEDNYDSSPSSSNP